MISVSGFVSCSSVVASFKLLEPFHGVLSQPDSMAVILLLLTICSDEVCVTPEDIDQSLLQALVDDMPHVASFRSVNSWTLSRVCHNLTRT